MPKVNRAGLTAAQPSPATFEPFWTTADGATVRLYLGDVEEVLRRLPAGSVQCVVTSPPYWGLRNYKAGGQEIGLEAAPQEYVDRMVGVFREVRRVLRDDGVLWLNLGDTYSGGSRGSAGAGPLSTKPKTNRGSYFSSDGETDDGRPRKSIGLLGGNLVGIPWRVALALQADGWVLRQDVIWHKPNGMPESVKNRCTKAHEYVFLLTKSMDYFYDMEAIKEKAVPASKVTTKKSASAGSAEGMGRKPSGNGVVGSVMETGPDKNKRSVWTVPSQGYEGSHFAVFPPKLIEPMILAGTSEHGCCAACGAPWRRVVEEKKLTRERPNDYTKRTGEDGTGNSCANSVAGVETRTVGWESGCTCTEAVLGEPVPCVVLDPFVGSGTTCCVAVENGRHGWGIDLSQQYLVKNAVPRIEGVLLARPGLARLLPSRDGAKAPPERKRLGG